MPTSAGWRPMHFANVGGRKLLLKSNFASSGYHVQLTDLCRVWDERLTKRDIIRRAWDDSCSIDPSEDDEQFRIFLDKIEGALNGNNGSSTDLAVDEDGSLVLQLSAPLPKPLPALKWRVSLTRQSEDAVGNTLIVPLLQHASDLQTQVQQLISELHDKDRVISKITDRLETSGNDLTTVFPGVCNIRTSKKKSQREQLARHVKGLADFDEKAWRSQSTLSNGHDRLWDKMDGVLQRLPTTEDNGVDSVSAFEWWRSLGDKENSAKVQNPLREHSSPPSATANVTPAAEDETMVDDEFQRQSTPEHVKRRVTVRSDTTQDLLSNATPEAPATQAPILQDDGDSMTEDEDDLDTVPKRKAVPTTETVPQVPLHDSPASSAGPSKRLGAIGGRSPRPPTSPAKANTPEKKVEPPKARSKLGAIGGKTKTSDEPREPPQREVAPVSPAPRKMGVIGGKRKPSNPVPPAAASPKASPSPEQDPERSRATTREPSPPPRETSRERADRKRDELKKELEQKAKAPAKKKRKF